VGVLQRFERRLEGLVEGAFARVFRGRVHPVEVAKALQREAEDKKSVLGPHRVLAPNRYVVELSTEDFEQLKPFVGELTGMIAEHLGEMGWTTYGGILVELEESEDTIPGTFRLAGTVDPNIPLAGPGPGAAGGGQAPGSGPMAPVRRADAGPRLVVVASEAHLAGHVFSLAAGTYLIGRGEDCHIRLPDVGVSRRHARLTSDGVNVVLSDMGSTNGILVNGYPVQEHPLRHGDRVQLGNTILTFRQDG
jgi:hypothetical protein